MYLQMFEKNNDFFNDFEGIHEPHFLAANSQKHNETSPLCSHCSALGIVIQWWKPCDRSCTAMLHHAL